MSQSVDLDLLAVKILESMPATVSQETVDFWLRPENGDLLRTNLRVALTPPPKATTSDFEDREVERLSLIMERTRERERIGTIYDRMSTEQLSRLLDRKVEIPASMANQGSSVQAIDMNRVYGIHEPTCMCGNCHRL